MTTCPYCGSGIARVDGARVHGADYVGDVWICARYPGCDAYVAARHDSGEPMGRLANAELRAAKNEAHQAFKPLWRFVARSSSLPFNEAQDATYRWLAERMGIMPDACRIALFDVDACRQAAAICRPFRDDPWNAGII